MGTTKKHEFDSDNEYYFSKWLEELEGIGGIEHIHYHPLPFLLSDKVLSNHFVKSTIGKNKTPRNKVLLNKHTYTPDFTFNIIPGTALSDTLINLFDQGQQNVQHVVCDVKAAYTQQDQASEFSMNRKWVYNKYSVYVVKVVPEKIYPLTFTPKLMVKDMVYKVGANKGNTKIKWKIKTIEEWMKEI